VATARVVKPVKPAITNPVSLAASPAVQVNPVAARDK